MPHRAWPLAQLLIVPRLVVPVGEATVCMNAVPRTGPLIAIGVFGVMRRLSALLLITTQLRLPVSWTSVIETPWASISLIASAAGRTPPVLVGPLGWRYCSLRFSWFCTISPRIELLSSRTPAGDRP